MKDNPLVSIVIINYNTAEVTIELLKSIQTETSYHPYEIILIDNASEKSDSETLKEFAESNPIRLYLMDSNLGWITGVNFGFREAKGDFLLTINSDVIVEKKWLSNMVDLIQTEKDIAAINANIFEDGKSIVTSTNGYLDILHGACSMFSLESWNLVGELDDKNFEFYGSENDWSYRARSIGYKLMLSEDSIVNHLGTSKITAGGGLSVKKTGRIRDFLKMRLDGRVKIRAYNFTTKDWFSRQVLSELKDSFLNGYLSLLIVSYLRVLLNVKNIYIERKRRGKRTSHGIKVIQSSNLNQ